MCAKIKGDPSFESIKVDSDVIVLPKLIRDIAFDIEANQNPFMAQVSAIKGFINFKFSTTTMKLLNMQD